ncbi:hypothetical protein BKA66DRAFT_434902, partial [Pyrenochaeta sp. MPI-SDFR-AT-0127]
AENRRTTEVEDIVYCILGILGVSMPTAYSEGQDLQDIIFSSHCNLTQRAESIRNCYPY